MKAQVRMRSKCFGSRCLIWILLHVVWFGRGVFAGLVAQCPNLASPDNGNVNVGGVSVGDTAAYTCDTGFTLDGTNFRECQDGYTWTDTAPTCNIKDCGTPTDPVGGAATYTDTTYQSTLTYSCNAGYTLTAGPTSATCTKDGDWDNGPPTCTIDDCLGLSDVTDGTVSAPVTTFGATATYTCTTGYHVTAGDETRTCQAGGQWDGTEPTCSIQDCNGLATPAGGSVVVTSTTYGSTATYSCDTGYDLNGAGTITCQADGTWETIPTCDIKDCGNLNGPTNGAVDLPSTTYNSVATFTCNLGYNLDGESSATCTVEGEWNATAPLCNITDCGTLEVPTDGNVNTDPGTVFEKTASYTCDAGYELIGDNIRRCEASGQWSSTAPTCQLYDCQAPQGIADGTVTLTSGLTTYGEQAQYDCDTGYSLSGNPTIACGDGTWSDPLPTCDDINECTLGTHNCDVNAACGNTVGSFTCTCNQGYSGDGLTCEDCGSLSNPSDATVTQTGTTYQDTATYVCDTGYEQTGGSLTRTCQADGTWSGSELVCTIEDCGDLTNPSGGTVTYTASTYLETATYSCSTGYQQTGGDTSRTCQAGGSWDGTEIVCQIYTCATLTDPADGSVTATGNSFGDTGTFSCDTGYDLVGSGLLTCGTGTWDNAAPTCTKKVCGSLNNPAGGTVTQTGTTYQDTATYVCDTGYEQTGGSLTRTCQADGTWSGSELVCTIEDCGDLTNPSRGTVTYTASTYLETATYSCSTGYQQTGGDTSRTCQAGGSWNGTEIVCQIYTCATLTDPADGSVTATGNSFGDTGTFSCDTGYDLVGSGLLTCGTGTWDNAAPTCTKKVCGSLNNPASCTVTQTGTTYQETATYVCDTGYEQTGGSLTRTCQADGTWSGSELVCTIEDCGDLTNPSGGTVTYTASTYLETAAYSCSTGYQRTGGDTSRTCQAGGSWNGTEIVCQIYTCAALTDPADGSVTATGNSFGDTGTFSCDTGYDLVGSGLLTCGTGTWDNAAPTCTKKVCGSLNNPAGGTVTQTGTTYQETATYVCDTGYEQTGGSLTRTCQADGTWSSSELVCTIEDCGDLTNPSGGTVTYTASTYLGTATYSCSTGYQQTGGDTSRTCQAGGSWNGTEIVCQIYTCATLTDPADGSVTATGNSFGDTGTFSCDTGYDLVGSGLLTCGTGTWDNAAPTCAKKDCGSLSEVLTNGGATQTGTKYLDTTVYTCNVGFMISRGNVDLTVTCQSDGNWDNSVPTCIQTDCGELTEPDDGQVNTQPGTLYQQLASYTCNQGYDLLGTNVRECQADGLWTGTAPTCQIIDCLALADPSDGSVNTSSGTTFFKVASYTCDSGYELTGNTDRTCQLDGNWDGTAPTCSRKNCGVLSTVISNGVATQSGTLYEDTTVYTCGTGFYISLGIVDNTVTCTATGSWDGTVATCIPVDCGDLTAPSGGQIEYPDTNYNTRASYTCNVGHDLSGTNVRTCTADGSWDRSEPVCQIKDCGSLTGIGDGSVAAPVTTYGQTAVYTCDTGYYIATGSASRGCDENGQWNGTEPTCAIYDCGSPGNGPFDTVSLSTTTYGSTAVYTCNTGYYLTAGDLTRTCGDGTWNGTAPTCTIRDCGSLNNPAGGTVAVTLTTFNEVALYTCATGYYENGGNSQHTCQADGTWDGTQLTCTIYDCGTPESTESGTVTYTGTTYGMVANYSCNTGYYTTDSVTRTCGEGTWSGSVPTCTIHDCGTLSPTVNQGLVVVSGTTYSETAVYTCNIGYLISGSPSNNLTLTCASNGRWDSPVPTCDAVDCGGLEAPVNGSVDTSSGTGYLDAAAYTCNHGYRLTGMNMRTCQADGSWSDSAPVCIVYDCGSLPPLGNGSVSFTVTTFSATAEYTCDTGFYMSAGSEVRTCEHGGFWNGTQPTCTMYDCGSLPNPADGVVSVIGQTFGETAFYICNTGYYRTAGDRARTCGSGTWSGEEPTCSLRDCGQLEDPTNGQVFLNGGTTYLQVANYTCNTGFHRSGGDNLRTCEADGNWNGTELICIVYDCGSLSDINNGDVTLTGTTYKDTATYTCDTGYYISAGDKTRTCMEGFWSGAQSVCTVFDCGSAGRLDNGQVNATGTQYMDTAIYTCNKGYLINGTESADVTRVCQDGGDWSGQLPTCFYVDCGALKHPDNGMVDVSLGTGLDDRAAYTCTTGYDLVGKNVRVCQTSGLWDGEEPSCKIKDCGRLGNPVNGEVTVTGTTYDEKATYTCNTGYYVGTGDPIRTCRSSGVWDGTEPVCFKSIDTTPDPSTGNKRDTVCGYRNEDLVFGIAVSSMTTQIDFQEMKLLVMNSVSRSNISSGDMRIGMFVFSQDIDHVIHLNDYNTSIELIQAIDSIPYSARSSLSRLNVGLKQLPVMFNLAFGDRRTVPNFAMIVVDDNVNMMGSLPVASQIRGGGIHLDIIAIGFTDTSEIASIAEDHIFPMDSFEVLHLYVKFVFWKDDSCDCGKVSSPDNGTVSVTGTFYLDVATFSCNEGYNLIGSRLLTCQYGGSWTGSPPTCLQEGLETTTVPSTTAEPDTAFCGYMNTDIIIALAVSRTIDKSEFDYMKELAQSMIDHSDIDRGSTRLGFFVFDSSVREGTVIGLNGSNTRPELRTDVDGIEYSPSAGSSELSAALKQIKIMGSVRAQTLLRLAFVVLDEDVSYTGAVEVADQLRDMGIILSFAAVGFTNLDTLLSLAFTQSPAFVWQIPNFPSLGYVASNILFKDDRCNCGSPSTPLQGSVSVAGTYFLDVASFSCDVGYELVGSHQLMCEYGGSWNGFSPSCSASTTPKPTDKPFIDISCGFQNVDLIIGLAVSSSTTPSDFQHIKMFLISVIEHTDIDSGTARLGSFVFDKSVQANTVISLNEFSTRSNQLRAVNDTQYSSTESQSDLTVGLRKLLAMFLSSNNSRKTGVPAMAFIVTDSSIIYNGTSALANQIRNAGIVLSFVTVDFNNIDDLQSLTELSFSPDNNYNLNLPSFSVLGMVFRMGIMFRDPECNCGILDSPSDGRVQFEETEGGVSTYYLDTVSFTCDQGYELVGSKELVCQYGGTWNNLPPECVPTGTTGIPSTTSASPTTPVLPDIDTDCGFQNLDVIFGVAVSRSITETDFEVIKNLIKLGIDSADVETGSTRIGFFIYGNEFALQTVALDRYTTRSELHRAIDSYQYIQSKSDLSLSLGLVEAQNMFLSTANRATIPDLLYMILDNNVDLAGASEVTAQIIAAGIRLDLIAVGFTESAKIQTLGHVIDFDKFNDLQTAVSAGEFYRNTLCNCGSLTSPSNGQVLFDDTYFLDTATFSCNQGYDLVGSQQLVCQYGGTWNGSPPACIPKASMKSVDLFISLNMTTGPDVNLTNNETYKKFRDGVQLALEEQYATLMKDNTSKIIINSLRLSSLLVNYTVIIPNTEASAQDFIQSTVSLAQGASVVILNESLSVTDMNIGESALNLVTETEESLTCLTFTAANGPCDLGYICQGEGTVPGCVPDPETDCGYPGSVLNGKVMTVDGTLYGTNAKYTCNVGYLIEGNNTRTCQPSGLWLPEAPKCLLIDCGSLASPVNGTVDLSGGTIYGQTATFSCRLGYILKGQRNLMCTENGTWSDIAPTCQINDCGSLASPVNGTVDLSGGTIYGQTATFSCRLGYILKGQRNLMCTENGTWSDIAPTCQINDLYCGRVLEPQHGSVFTSNLSRINSTATFRCNTGYRIVGPGTRTCSVKMAWEPQQETVCVIRDCGDLASPVSGTVDLSGGTTYGQTATFSCHLGYNLKGQRNLKCIENGTWSYITPTCEINDFYCGRALEPQHGSVFTSHLSRINSTATFRCNTGYRMVGPGTRTCSVKMAWEPQQETVCVIRDCGILRNPSNGNVDQSSGTTFGQIATFSCSVGYQIFGTEQSTCMANGNWSTAPPICQITNCGGLLTPDNGFVSASQTTFGQVAVYTCYPGYTVSGSSSRICQPDGTWSGREPSCEPRDCGSLFNPINGFVNTSMGTTFGSTAIYSCSEGYNLGGPSTTKCETNGIWYPPMAPTCVVIDCGMLVDPQFGSVTLSQGTRFESVVTYSCDTGYNISGPTTRQCLSTGKWSDLQPQTACSIVDCGNLPDILYGSVLYQDSSTVFGSAATLSCNLGYYLSTTRTTAKCEETGRWDLGLMPVCLIQDCGIPSVIENGIRLFKNTTYGSMVTYTCSQGYELTGSGMVNCSETGIWGTLPICTKIDCGELQAPFNGSITFSAGTGLGSKAIFYCDRGFYLTGSNISLCSEGLWTHSTPSCSLQDCGSLPQPVDGSMTLTDGTVYSSIAKFTCNTGYKLSGPESRTCSDGGKWEPEQTTSCSLQDCGVFQNPVNGNIDQSSGTTYGQTVEFSCSVGYEIFGSDRATCMSDGRWSSQAPVCQVTDCGGLPSPDNGLVLAGQTTFGQVATYTCNEGYTLSGTSRRSCQPDGSWSSSPPVCLVKDCGSLPDPVFGSVEYSSSLYGSVAVYSCDVGYSLDGVSERSCAADGRWSGATPTCTIIDCGGLSSVQFGSFSPPQRNIYGTTVTFSCDTGYQLIGNSTVRCLGTSQWSPLPSCKIKDCGDLSQPDNGLLTLPGGTTYGQTALFSCKTGYLPTGPTQLQCMEDGSWSAAPPLCQLADCGFLTDPVNGGVTVSGTKFGSYATYVCDAGHQITGSPSRLCQEDGKWSGSKPSCVIRDCGRVNAPTNGDVSMSSGTTYGNIATFSCNERYELVGLSTLVCRADGKWSSQRPTCSLQDGFLSKDLTVRLNMTVPEGLSFSNPFTYSSYKNEVETALMQHYGAKIKDVIEDININSLKLGSLIVDYTVILKDSEDTVKNFTVASLDLAQGSTLLVFNQNLGVDRMTVDDSQVDLLLLSAEELACRLFLELLGPCQTGYVCTLVGNTPEYCGIPGTPSNGAVDYSRGTLLGDTIIYTCNSGYTLVGHNTRTCQGGGNWAPDAPTCSLTDCGTLGELENGLVTVGGTFIGQTAFFSCNPGYSLIGASVVTCQLDGTWSNPTPTCRITGCGDLPSPVHGTVIVTVDGGTAQYTCQTGFTLIGDSLRTCLASKFWSGSAPTCRAIECFNLPDPVNGRVDITGTSYGSTATYQCTRVGYTLSGPNTRMCSQDGQWSRNAPSCDIIECDILPPISNGNMDIIDRTYGQTVSYTCNQGFKLQGAQTLTCRAYGWSSTPPTCRSSGDCGPLDNPMYGYVTFTQGTTFLSKATYSCYMGYKLTGSVERVCQADNTWSGIPATCVLVDCGQPTQPEGGRVMYTSGTTYGRVATYTCNPGYDLIGSTTVTCQNNETWSNNPICRAKDCGSLPNPLNGQIDTVAGTLFGATAVYICNPGYYLQGVSTRTCLATGYWDSLVPNCLVIDCGLLATPTHGAVNIPSGTTYGQTASYSCNIGYTLSGSASRQCAVDGSWTGTQPVCTAIVCETLGNLGNGQVSLSKGLGVGSVATYTCNSGYVLSPASNTERTCKNDGSWTGTQPVCNFIDCGSLSAPMFGNVKIDQTTFGHSVSYTCNEGYMMSGSKERTCNSDGMWSGTQPVCTVTNCGLLGNPDNGKVTMADGTLFGNIAVYKCNTGYSVKSYNKRTCQSNGTWSGEAPSCQSSREFALAVGLGAGLGGFVILVLVIVLIIVLLYRRSRHFERKPPRMYPMPGPVAVPPPLPMKINTGPTMLVPYYTDPLVVDDASAYSDRQTTWRSKKADYDPTNPLYYNSTMPRNEFYSLNR